MIVERQVLINAYTGMTSKSLHARIFFLIFFVSFEEDWETVLRNIWNYIISCAIFGKLRQHSMPVSINLVRAHCLIIRSTPL